MSDENRIIMELSARTVKERRSPHSRAQLSRIEMSQINLEANSYVESIDWQQNTYDQPILRDITDNEIKQNR